MLVGPPSADRRGYNAACYYITEPRTEPSSGEKLLNSAEPNTNRASGLQHYPEATARISRFRGRMAAVS